MILLLIMKPFGGRPPAVRRPFPALEGCGCHTSHHDCAIARAAPGAGPRPTSLPSSLPCLHCPGSPGGHGTASASGAAFAPPVVCGPRWHTSCFQEFLCELAGFREAVCTRLCHCTQAQFQDSFPGCMPFVVSLSAFSATPPVPGGRQRPGGLGPYPLPSVALSPSPLMTR